MILPGKAISISLQHEAIDKDSQLHSSSNFNKLLSTNLVERSPNNQGQKEHAYSATFQIWYWEYCRGSHAKNRCPAYGKLCNSCNRPNHFQSQCKQRKGQRSLTNRMDTTVKVVEENEISDNPTVSNVQVGLGIDDVWVNIVSENNVTFWSLSLMIQLRIYNQEYDLLVDTSACNMF